ncbi:tumor necrosis factor receptor superfamily member 19L [Mixophyes fleayi]|uniref:tumor necrosis factor receptor superfamily member 19L n=1 Tax=Mixophyes fleayi TaxID=3061075 RepID=UPI003F4DFC77
MSPLYRLKRSSWEMLEASFGTQFSHRDPRLDRTGAHAAPGPAYQIISGEDAQLLSKMRNVHLLVSCLLTLQILEGLCQECGKAEYLDDEGQCIHCRRCPAGQEPDGICGFGSGAGVGCRVCAPGSFSSRLDMSPCILHTQCNKRKRIQRTAGTRSTDAMCGDCLTGFFPLVSNSVSTCIACWLAPPDTAGCEGQRTLRGRSPRTLEAAIKPDPNSSLNSTRKGVQEDSGTQYAVLAIVPVFCMMGLTGIFLCNLLKKKGYHCTAQKELDEEACPEKEGINPSDMLEENGNEDTIGVLVRLITEKKENAVALEELLKDYQNKQISTIGNKSPQSRLHLLPQMPNLCKHQHHLHTVQGLASRSGTCCTRCSQKKWPQVLASPQPATVPAAVTKTVRTGTKAARVGEITILSVGRFRVARIPEQKPNPPEVKAISELGGGNAQGLPQNDASEQRVLLSNTVRAKNRSLEDTSKLEDVI